MSLIDQINLEAAESSDDYLLTYLLYGAEPFLRS